MLQKILTLLTLGLELALRIMSYVKERNKEADKANRVDTYNSVVDGVFARRDERRAKGSSNPDDGTNSN